ncbi:MAG: Ger(x)C family spore germination protein [Bacillota bacterium]
MLIAALAIFLTVLTVLPSGCWDRREPDLLGLITIAAFDLDDSGLIKVYAQLANPVGAGQQQNGGGGGSNEKRTSIWALEATGHTVYQAIKNMELRSTRELLWTHVEVVLFSEKLARRGIRPVLDFIEREPQIRLIARPFVVQGEMGRLMQAEFPLEQFGATALSKQIISIRDELAYTSDTDSVRVMLHHLTTPGWELDLPRIVVLEEDEANGNNRAGRQNPALISGMAVFRGDKLVGFFDYKETAGYMWLRGEVEQHVLVLQCPDHEEDLLTVQIFESRVELTPQINGDEVRFKAAIFAEGRIEEFYCQDLPPEDEFIASLNRRLATAIRNEAAAGLEKGRELGADVFGLGNIIYRTRNKDWQRFGENWIEMFPEVMVDLDVQAVIRRHGLNLAPIKIR